MPVMHRGLIATAGHQPLLPHLVSDRPGLGGELASQPTARFINPGSSTPQSLKPRSLCARPPVSVPRDVRSSHGTHRDGFLRHLRGSFPGAQVHRRPPRRQPPLLQQPRQRQQRWKDQVHAGVADRGHQEVRDALVPAPSLRGVSPEANRVPHPLQVGSLPGVQQGWLRLPRAQQLPWILRRQVLDNVEAAHVRVHRRHAGAQGAGGGQEGVPRRLRPHHRLRQHPAGAVHQLHRLQATGLRGVRQGLNSSSLILIDLLESHIYV